MKTIVVAYDDTAPSKRALDRAATLAEAFGSHVLVISIARLTHTAPRTATHLGRSEGHAERSEDVQEAQEFLAARGIDVEPITMLGDPASAIAQLADERSADLVVIGTRALGPVQRLLGQSVSQAVSRRVNCDVLIVHPGPEAAES